ncbi:MAG: hypothetical protein GYB24_07565 [Rhodobacteraceae bacterium]|nr:hypothetical protein [Paracoccaceae bacterium]
MIEIVELGWRTQIVFVSGYLGYIIAYSGRREAHGPIDTAGIVFSFGGIGLLAIALISSCLSDSGNRDYLLGVSAVAASVSAAIIWRRFGADLTRYLVEKLSGNRDDGLPTAWATIIQRQNLTYTQLVITLNDGTVYESYPLGNFQHFPNGPCVLGSDGSIGMYVTYITEADGNGRNTVYINDDDGMRMTYIPSNQIKEIDVRRKA